MRTPPDDLGADAELALSEALESLGLHLVPPPPGADLAVDLGDNRRVEVEVRWLAHAGPSRVRAGIARARGRRNAGRVVVMVADTIPGSSRRLLDEASWGWFDRRGHLRLRADGLHVDSDVRPSARRQHQGTRSTIAGTAGLATALRLLMEPGIPFGVRATAAEAGLHPSSISRALARLRDESLVHADDTPLVPDLFWAVADVWPRDGRLLEREPRPDDPRAGQFDMNVAALEVAGWAVTGTRAAVAWGVPLFVSGSFPPELLVPSDAVVRRARQRFGDATTERSAAAVIRAAATQLAVRRRIKLPEETFPVAHPVVVALDLAGDVSRGVEALEAWTPPAPYVRVW